MKIDNHEIENNQLCVIAPTVVMVKGNLFPNDNIMSCELCNENVVVANSGAYMVINGAHLYCISCAVVFYPDMVAGCNPDTGETATLKEIMSHPNLAGAYRYRDVKEI